jgi:hypothetical protein
MSKFVAPAPPSNVVMPATAQHVFLVVMSAMAVAAVGFSIRESRRRGDIVPLYLLAGAAVAIFYEPLGDFLVLALYPIRHQTGWIQMFGHKVPLFIEILYFWYFCPFVLLFMRMAQRGFTARSWWALWGGALAFASGFEVLGLHLKTWLYYGHQPLVVLKLPLWIPFTYVSFLFAIGAGVYGIANHLGRRHHWLIVPAMPLLLAASHAATSFPGASALYSTSDRTVILLACIGSMAAAVLLAYVLWLTLRRASVATASNGARRTHEPFVAVETRPLART